MQSAKINKSVSDQIRGINFRGNIQIKGNVLNLDLIQFKKGSFFTIQITNINLQKEFKRFLIFKKIDDLYNELLQNQNLQISDENTLIIPVDVTYKNKIFDLKIQIPLFQRKFNNEAEKMQNLFSQIERLSQKQKLISPQVIHFRPDQTNQRIKSFEIYDNRRKIKMLGTNVHINLNHSEPLKNKGVFYFKVKIIKTAKNMFTGICGNDIKSVLNSYGSPYFFCLHLTNGCLYGNNKNPSVASGYTIVDGQSVIKTQFDMNKRCISWFHNDSLLCAAQIPKEFSNIDIYPMVNLQNNGDIIELLDT